jgi:hypothetical protein
VAIRAPWEGNAAYAGMEIQIIDNKGYWKGYKKAINHSYHPAYVPVYVPVRRRFRPYKHGTRINVGIGFNL